MVRTARRTRGGGGAGPSSGAWRLLLLLALAVAVPTACVLYSTNQAVRNARLAVRQKLVQAYEPPLHEAASEIASYWQDRADALVKALPEAAPPEQFAELVTSGVCTSAVIYDEAGNVTYPAQTGPADWAESEPPAAWAEARRLVEAGDTAGAVELLAGLLADPESADTRDAAGRLIGPLAGLRALELIADPEDARHGDMRDTLATRLNDYSPPLVPPAQRRFLMRRLREMAGDEVAFPTLPAEEVAADYLTEAPAVPPASELTPSALPGVWRLASEDGSVVGLFGEQDFLEDMRSLAREKAAMPGTSVDLRRPDEAAGDEDAFLAAPLGAALPGWRLALMLEGEDPFSAAAQKEVAGYLWASLLSVGAIVLFALIGGRLLLRQARLTRLKNDFIATVTHELKTPLASIRMFAETLREGRYEDEAQARRYLDLLVRENERLSRLIDNFLSFSRMERDRRAFEMHELRPQEIAQEAADVVSERFRAAGCDFETDIEPSLPTIRGDRDALVTVLLNLLDNAFKYTGEDKRIALRARAAGGQVCFEVEDNGIGMSRREVRRAFDRFYQADSRLSRRAEGCGLGLSIVRFIVDAHGGSVEIESAPGKGSTFTVRLPAAGRLPAATSEAEEP